MRPALRQILLANGQPALLSWRAAKGRVVSGAGNAQIGIIGTSRTTGVGSNGATYIGCVANAYPRQIAAKLTALGIPAVEQSVFGTHRLDSTGLTNCLAAETRISASGGWTNFGSDSIAGFMFFNSTDTAAWSFTPQAAVDTLNIYTFAASTYAGWTWDVDGGSATTISPTGSSRVLKTVAGVTRGTHTLNLKRNGTNANFLLIGVDARDSTKNQVYVHNLGSYGSQASFWNTSANVWSALPMIGILACDLWIIELGPNEWINNISAATFKTNMQPIIAACKATGDVILEVPAYSSTSASGSSTIANQVAIMSAVYDLAKANNLRVVDNSRILGDYNTANNAGEMFDFTHESGSGYAAEMAPMAALLAAA